MLSTQNGHWRARLPLPQDAHDGPVAVFAGLNRKTTPSLVWGYFLLFSELDIWGVTITLHNFLHLVEVNVFEKITLGQMVLNAMESNSVTS